MSAADARIALCRFGLGNGPGEIGRIAADPRAWADRQLDAPDAAAAPPLTGFKSTPERIAELRALRAARREADDPAEVKRLRAAAREQFRDEMEARLRWAAATPFPLVERLVWFWSNHFTVSVRKPQLLGLAGPFEREAVRPHVLDRFEDMLLAVAHHPAMLIYLDNAQSVGPGSPIGQRRQVGLNENLAREMMELHTLGVDGGYGQADVIALARILTGWGVALREEELAVGAGFAFHPRAHEPGPKTLLGRVFDEDGEAEGVAAIRMLAAHPATARFIARKLVRHLVADRPEPEEVAGVAERFAATGGDLRATVRAVLALPRAWRPERAKLRTPAELAVATARALGVPEGDGVPLVRACRMLGALPFAATSPAGYPDVAAAWAGPDAVLNRVEWCAAAAAYAPQGRAADFDPGAFARDLLGPAASAASLAAIDRAPSRREALGLVLASPEFQWR